MDRTIHVVLVVEQTLLRDSLAAALSLGGRLRLTACETTRDALEVAARRPAEVVVVDSDGPNPVRPEFMSEIRASGYDGPFLVMASGPNPHVEKWMSNGGTIFLKGESIQELSNRIDQLASGKPPVDQVSQAAMRRRIARAEGVWPLTSREAAVLEATAAGLSNKSISERLSISIPLVKAALRQLFKKTGAQSRAQLVRLAMERYGL